MEPERFLLGQFRNIVPAAWLNAWKLLREFVRRGLIVGRNAFTRFVVEMRSTKGVFDDIYRSNQWGGERGAIYSGPGSRGEMAKLYIDAVGAFVMQNGVKSIVDIGCGDFYIASQILDRVGGDISYVGLDAAKAVIESNNARFARDRVVFHWADAAKDNLPEADLCLIRQVLQHLSNRKIAAILVKLKHFKWAIITEHYPHHSCFKAFNTDIAQGAETRLVHGSAVYLDRAPFNLRIIALLAEVDVDRGNPLEGQLRTWLVDTKASNIDANQSPSGDYIAC